MAPVKGSHGEVKARYRQREAHAVIRVCGWSALGFPGQVWSIPPEGVSLICYVETFSEEDTRGRS